MDGFEIFDNTECRSMRPIKVFGPVRRTVQFQARSIGSMIVIVTKA